MLTLRAQVLTVPICLHIIGVGRNRRIRSDCLSSEQMFYFQLVSRMSRTHKDFEKEQIEAMMEAHPSLLDLEYLESISTQIVEKKRKPVEACYLINELIK